MRTTRALNGLNFKIITRQQEKNGLRIYPNYVQNIILLIHFFENMRKLSILSFNQTLKCATLNPLNPLNPLFDFTKVLTKGIRN